MESNNVREENRDIVNCFSCLGRVGKSKCRTEFIPFMSLKENMTMNRDELLKRISINPQVCFGKPCIRGHRIWVSFMLDLLASGWNFEQVLANYPGIEENDIRACIAYGAEMSRERYVELPVGGQT